MALLTAIVDVLDSSGNSVVANNADGTRPLVKIKLAAGLAATYAKSGDTGIVIIAPSGTAPGDLDVVGDLHVEGTSTLDGAVFLGGAGDDGSGATISGPLDFSIYVVPEGDDVASVPLISWDSANAAGVLGGAGLDAVQIAGGVDWQFIADGTHEIDFDGSTGDINGGRDLNLGRNLAIGGTAIAWSDVTAAVAIRHTARSGAGANAGASWLIQAQSGQDQSGGAANNDGGRMEIAGGSAGVSGGGAAGHTGGMRARGGWLDLQATDTATASLTTPTAGTMRLRADTSIDIGTKIKVDSTGIGEYGHATTGVGPTFTQTYSTSATTFSAYTSDPESGAYTGIDNLQVGTPYAQVADLNALRVAYETLRVHAEEQGKLINALLDYFQARGTIG